MPGAFLITPYPCFFKRIFDHFYDKTFKNPFLKIKLEH